VSRKKLKFYVFILMNLYKVNVKFYPRIGHEVPEKEREREREGERE
jgi:hypothetical protein